MAGNSAPRRAWCRGARRNGCAVPDRDRRDAGEREAGGCDQRPRRSHPVHPRRKDPVRALCGQAVAARASFEAEAQAVHNYESLFIPGLLQTPDYGRAMVHGVLPAATTEEVDQRVRARTERQKLLDAEHPLELWAVMDEAAIRREVGGPQVMAAQLDQLTHAAQRPNITAQVITFSSGAHPGMPGSFAHTEFRNDLDPDLVYVDTLAGDIFLETDDDIRRYRSLFDHLRVKAMASSRRPDASGYACTPAPPGPSAPLARFLTGSNSTASSSGLLGLIDHALLVARTLYVTGRSSPPMIRR
jgi:hypothetical protein